MDGQHWQVQLARGSAVVARFGDVVLVAAPTDDRQERFVDSVLEACRTAAAEHPDKPGQRLVRKVASSVAQADVDDVPPLGLLASLGGDVAALLVGEVDLEVRASDAKEVLSGRDASTWVDRIVRAPFDALTLTVDGAGDVDLRSDLGSGTVTAGGVVVAPASAAAAPAAAAPAPAVAAQEAPAAAAPPVAAAPEPAAVAPEAPAAAAPPVAAAPEPAAVAPEVPPAAAAPEPPTSAVPVPESQLPAPGAPLHETAPEPAAVPARSTAGAFQTFALDEPDASADPLPVEGGPGAQEDDAPQVQGINCSRGHFNDPTSVYCTACGISMVHQTHNLVKGKRPTLGVLVFDDGSVVPLTRDYVLGREPEGAPQVQDGSATPLQIDDPDLKVSRVHARIQLRDWDVRVVDLGSANGTFVLKKGQTEWTRLVTDEPVTITPGSRVSVGTRTLEYESHHKA